jgi:hypothetical protein
MRRGCFATWVIGLLTAFGAPIVRAEPVLMALDGQSAHNIEKAQALGHTVTMAWLSDIRNMTPEALASYDAVFVSPGFGNTGYDALRNSVRSGGSLQRYAAAGGTIVLNVAGNFGDQANIAPGGVDFVVTIHNRETFASPSHRYLTGATSEHDDYDGHQLVPGDFNDWINTDHGYLTNLRGQTITILRNTNGSSMVEYGEGGGRVIVSTLTVGWAQFGESRGKAQDNMINYALETPVPEPTTLVLFAAAAVAVLGRRSTH